MFGKKIQQKRKFTQGKWTRAEHDRFLKALELHGKNWGLVQKRVKTRSIVQVRSHAQKVFQNMSKEDVEALIGIEEEQTEEPDFIQSQVGLNQGERCCQKEKKIQKKEQAETSLFHILKGQVERTSEEEDQERNQERKGKMDESIWMCRESLFGKILQENLTYFEKGGDFLSMIPSSRNYEADFHTEENKKQKISLPLTIG